MPDPVTIGHGWWLITNRGVHGRTCRACRRSPGGPDHADTTTTQETRRHG